jgi:hypothetical protein
MEAQGQPSDNSSLSSHNPLPEPIHDEMGVHRHVDSDEDFSEADLNHYDGEPLPVKRKGALSFSRWTPNQEKREHQLQHRISSLTYAAL